MSEAPRVVAVRLLERVLDGGETVDEAWGRLAGRAAPADRPLIQALLYGALRWLTQLEAQVAAVTPRQQWRRDPTLRALLVLGAWEAQGLSTPAHAAVSEAVAAARTLHRARAAGMVNAVLRRLRREPPPLADDEATRFALPPWLLHRLRQAWPQAWPGLAQALTAHPPLTLRVNRAQTSRDAYLAELHAAGLPAHPGTLAAGAVRLETPCPVDRLPGFDAGVVSVQDEAAQCVAPLLDPQPGDRVLDACAAPGGKTLHLLEYAAPLAVTAVDRSARRLRQVAANLTRAGVNADCIAADAAQPEAWWDGRPYQRILLDAPCTGTGVIRRHPDIKWLRGPQDGARMAVAQRRLLEALWPLLAPGGRLLYVTCSLLPEENDAVVAAFLADHPEAIPGARPAWGRPAGAGWQLLPGDADTDGFFFAALERPAAGGAGPRAR